MCMQMPVSQAPAQDTKSVNIESARIRQCVIVLVYTSFGACTQTVLPGSNEPAKRVIKSMALRLVRNRDGWSASVRIWLCQNVPRLCVVTLTGVSSAYVPERAHDTRLLSGVEI
jgi:hypothetical protein